MDTQTEKIFQFNLIFNQLKTKVFNYISKMIKDKMTTEDIFQNVFIKFYEHYDSVENKANAQFWIFKVARNEVYEYFRSKGVRTDQFNVDDIEELEIEDEKILTDIFEFNELKEKLTIILDELPLEQKEVFLLKEYEGLSYKEIANLIKIPEDLVKSRLFKTRQKLIKKLQLIYR